MGRRTCQALARRVFGLEVDDHAVIEARPPAAYPFSPPRECEGGRDRAGGHLTTVDLGDQGIAGPIDGRHRRAQICSAFHG